MKHDTSKKYYKKRGQKINTLKKGVYILPNFLTSLSLFCGFYSMVSSMGGEFVLAAWAIIVSAIFDGLDGRVARMTHTTSKFGVEYDSLADLVAFGVAPAILAHALVLNQYGRWGWLAAFLYMACGAIRLARFNTMLNVVKSDHFQGIPIPAAAGMVASIVIFCFHFNIADKMLLSIFLLSTMYALAFLMVSSIKFNSFKNLNLGKRKPFSAVVVAILLICILASEPQIMLFVIMTAYVISGPASYLITMSKKNRLKNKEEVTSEGGDNHHETNS
jgi:CDP-diacylglycerol---serine O-phosphatidyltransferase